MADEIRKNERWELINPPYSLPYIQTVGGDRIVAERVYNGKGSLLAAAPALALALADLLNDCGFSCDSDQCECGPNGDGTDDDGLPCVHRRAAQALAQAQS